MTAPRRGARLLLRFWHHFVVQLFSDSVPVVFASLQPPATICQPYELMSTIASITQPLLFLIPADSLYGEEHFRNLSVHRRAARSISHSNSPQGETH